jgi:Beta-lactamase class C and other penicillin binding proteins
MRFLMLCLLALLGPSALAHAQTPARANPYNFRPVTNFVNGFVGSSDQALLEGASLIVLQDGQPIYKRNFGSYAGNGPTVPIASASKWLSALVIERLVEAGTMRWDDTVADYFGSDYPNPDPQKGAITLGQLLSHTSGMTVVNAACLAYPYRNMPLDDCARSILGTPLRWSPGTVFAYGENSMQVAGAMAQRVTGKSWAQLVASELTGPLALTRTDYGANGNGVPFSNPIIAGGARSNLQDYAKVVQMVLQRGLFDGSQYLAPASIAEMQLDQTHGVPADPDSNPYPEAYGYGYGEWRNTVDCSGVATRISSTGILGTSPWVDYDHGTAAVFLTYKQNPDPNLRDKLRQLWDVVGDVIGGPVGCAL